MRRAPRAMRSSFREMALSYASIEMPLPRAPPQVADGAHGSSSAYTRKCFDSFRPWAW
jgi:hypothetical protein